VNVRKLNDPPGPGEAKLRIRSNGEWPGTRVYAVTHDGVEHELLGVVRVGFDLAPPGDRESPYSGIGVAKLDMLDADVELDVPVVTVEPAK
jgi:hypothetical protein